MKKIYLCVMALSVSVLSYGQATQKKISFGATNEIKSTNDLVLTENALKHFEKQPTNKAITTIWSDDFDIPANWVINNDGQTGAEFGWTIDAVSDGWWSANGITSTSGGNFAELSNGNPTLTPGTQALNVTYTLTTAAPLNLVALGGSDKVFLEFEQFGARFNDLQEIQISTDGTNFVPVGDNLDKAVLSQANPNNAYPNPDLKLVNLTPFLTPTTATSVWIRFSWTTNFPTQSTNANVWVAYGWYIDDLKIKTLPGNDLATALPYYGSLGWEYTRIPVAQIAPIDFGLQVKNEGINDITGVVLTANINSGALTFASTSSTSLSLTTDTIFTAPFTPPATVGVPYTAVLSLSSDSIDEIPGNNPTFTLNPFEVSQYVYARDDFGTPGNGGGSGPTIDEFEAGNLFDIFANQTLYAIDVVVGTNSSNVGAFIDAVIYQFDGQTGVFTEIDRANGYTVATGDLGNKITFAMPNTPTLIAGNSYFAAVHTLNLFTYGTSGTSLTFATNVGGGGNTSLIYYPDMANPNTGETFLTSSTPMVRMNFDPLNAVNELSNNTTFSVFPNPSNAIFNIVLDSKSTEVVNLTVNNIVGQTVLTNRVTVSGQTRETISLADFDKGIYFLTIDNNNEKQTVKLIVE